MTSNLKVAKAFRAMRELGIPEGRTKSALMNLLKINDKNWELVEEENYGALADAIFNSKEAEAAEQKNKLEQNELMKVIEEETQIPEVPERPLKQLLLRYQEEPSGTGSISNSHVTPLKKSKLEIDGLPYAIPRSQARAMAITESLTNGDSSNDLDLPKEADQPQSADNENSSNKTRGHELAMILEESTERLDIASSSSGEIKIFNSNSTVKGNSSVDALSMKMEGNCRNSYKFLEPNFSVKETNSIPPTDSLGTCVSNTNADTISHANADTNVTAEANANGSVSVVMRKIEKPRVCSDDSYFRYLPDEVFLLILNKLIDLKTLCCCKLVSTLFILMVHQVDTISFVASRVDNPSYDSNPSSDAGLPNPFYHLGPMVDVPSEHGVPAASYECESFRFAIQSMSKFTRLKSLCIELPSTRQDVDNDSDLYKWNVKFGSKIESLVFLSPNSICDMEGLLKVNGNSQGKEQDHLDSFKVQLAFDCLRDAAVRFWMLLGCTINFPLLEKVLITQSGKRGSVSISGKDIVEMRNWLHSPTDSLEQKLSDSVVLPTGRTRCILPLLKLPVTGYLMKGVTLVTFQKKGLRGGFDSYMNINLNDFEDKEEAAYCEAVMEMLKIFGKVQVHDMEDF